MFEKFFAKYPAYEIIGKPSQAEVKQYRGILPEEILHIWQDYGFGIFMDGYLRFIDPSEFQEFSDEYIENIGDRSTPFAITAMGDLLTFTSRDKIYFYDYRHQSFDVIGSGDKLDILFDIKFVDTSYILTKLKCSTYYDLKAKLGTPAYDQCYGYFPLLSLGGSESIEHVQIVDLKVHIDLMAQVSGPL